MLINSQINYMQNRIWKFDYLISKITIYKGNHFLQHLKSFSNSFKPFLYKGLPTQAIPCFV